MPFAFSFLACLLDNVRRILLIGSGGSGKTTLAKEIARRTGLPLIHLDQLFWRPGWVPTPDDEWDATILELSRREAWIMDGNYGRTLPVRLARADAVVFLDVHPLVCMYRVIKRRLKTRGVRPDVAPGCPEKLDWSFVQWILTFRMARRPGILAMLEATDPKVQVHVLRSDADARQFLAQNLTRNASEPVVAKHGEEQT